MPGGMGKRAAQMAWICRSGIVAARLPVRGAASPGARASDGRARLLQKLSLRAHHLPTQGRAQPAHVFLPEDRARLRPMGLQQGWTI